MRFRALLLATTILLPCASGFDARAQQPTSPPAAAPQIPQAGFSEIVKQALPSVVTLFSVEHFLTRRPQMDHGYTALPGQPRPLGSGFVVDSDGRVATTLSLVGDAEDIRAALTDGRTVEAVVVGRDQANNIAILQLGSAANVRPLRLADQDSVQMGDWTVAVGRPLPHIPRIAVGVVAAPPGDLLWLDNSSRGLAGGPLLDSRGTVIGIAAILRTSVGDEMTIGIPAAAVREALSKANKLQTAGPARLGVQVQPVTEALARAIGLDEPEGALVAFVEPGSPAAQAGIKPGDVITAIGESDIAFARDLPALIATADTSKPTQIELWRDRQTTKVDAQLVAAAAPAPGTPAGTSPQQATPQRTSPAAKQEDQQPSLGIALAPLTPEIKGQIGLGGEATGVVIVGVQPGSIAAQSGLQPGDVIVEVAGTAVNDPARLAELVRENRTKGGSGLMLRINRHGSFGYVVLPG